MSAFVENTIGHTAGAGFWVMRCSELRNCAEFHFDPFGTIISVPLAANREERAARFPHLDLV
jgi:hypothetical protein